MRVRVNVDFGVGLMVWFVVKVGVVVMSRSDSGSVSGWW